MLTANYLPEFPGQPGRNIIHERYITRINMRGGGSFLFASSRYNLYYSTPFQLINEGVGLFLDIKAEI